MKSIISDIFKFEFNSKNQVTYKFTTLLRNKLTTWDTLIAVPVVTKMKIDLTK